jgi:hypothetical protein
LSQPDEPPAEPPDDDFVVETMKLWERWVAIVLGVILAGLGVWAVFKSSNQAGSAVLLLMGAAFLLIGVQGTPLIKIGGSTANLELERRRRRFEKAIEQAKSETNPDVAQGMIEATTILEPQLASSPRAQASLQGSLYYDRVEGALKGIFEGVEREPMRGQFDFAVTTPMGQTAIVIKYRRVGPFRANDVADLVRRHKGQASKLVIVTNAPLSEEVRSINSAGTYDEMTVEVVTWNDAGDDNLLHRAVLRGSS